MRRILSLCRHFHITFAGLFLDQFIDLLFGRRRILAISEVLGVQDGRIVTIAGGIPFNGTPSPDGIPATETSLENEMIGTCAGRAIRETAETSSPSSGPRISLLPSAIARVGCQFGPQPQQVQPHLRVDGVAHFRPVQGDLPHMRGNDVAAQGFENKG